MTPAVRVWLENIPRAPENTLEVLLSHTGEAQSAKRFVMKTLAASHRSIPRVILVEKNAAYPKALNKLQAAGSCPNQGELRQGKELNSMVEQDQRSLKRLAKPGLGFFCLQTAWRTRAGEMRS
jgi:transposase, IS6 family